MRILSQPGELRIPTGKIISDGQPSSEPGFARELQKSLAQVDHLQHQADQAIEDGAVKGTAPIDETMIKLEEADIGLRMLSKVRNKALEAYQEVMRMQF
jgi:flagellar hook-basal body complex protein FliE